MQGEACSIVSMSTAEMKGARSWRLEAHSRASRLASSELTMRLKHCLAKSVIERPAAHVGSTAWSMLSLELSRHRRVHHEHMEDLGPPFQTSLSASDPFPMAWRSFPGRAARLDWITSWLLASPTRRYHDV